MRGPHCPDKLSSRSNEMCVKCCFILQAEIKQDETVVEKCKKLFQTAVSLCVLNGGMTPERAHSYCRSGELQNLLMQLFLNCSDMIYFHLSTPNPALDVDLRYALEDSAHNDISGRCLVYIHKVIFAQPENTQTKSHQLEVKAMSRKTDITNSHFI